MAGALAQRRTKTCSGWFQALQRKKPAAAFMSAHQVGKTRHKPHHKIIFDPINKNNQHNGKRK